MIIAILAAIAVPAFGKVREKANETSDLANARIIYSVVTASIAEGTTPVPSNESDKTQMDVTEDKRSELISMGLTTIPKPRNGEKFQFEVNSQGNVAILLDGKQIYPEDNTK